MEKTIALAAAIKRLEGGHPPPEDGGIFGAHIDPEECSLILLPAPWDATASYGKGTADGPLSMVAASHQMDLEDPSFGEVYRQGIGFDLECFEQISQLSGRANDAAIDQVNELSAALNETIYTRSHHWLQRGKKVAVLGGEHSVPFGLVKALAEIHSEFGILHVDAHFDLREAYEGYKHSHASIMFNVLDSFPQITRLNQLGIRDYSGDERKLQTSLGNRGAVVFDRQLQLEKCSGRSFVDSCRHLVDSLPPKVYVSFDIDGLNPSLCPSTGTPVPGGLEYGEAQSLLILLAESGKTVIGFDLCEVAPDPGGNEWDANVGARILYLLAGLALQS